jgi:DNA repair protein RecN (Recombination protein N)
LLVDVHGPHDHQSLLATEKQTELLDAYGKLAPLREICATAHGALRGIERERASAHLQPDEDVKVENEYRAASHSQNILEQAATITSLLNDSENATLTQLAQVERALTAWQRMDVSISEAEAINRQAIAQLQELLATVQERAERVDLDPAQLRQLEDRLNLVQSLKRKYGGSMEAVVAFGEKAAAQLAALEGSAEFLATLAGREKAARLGLEKAAAELSKARWKIAGPLGEKISQELRALGFSKAVFQVELSPTPPGASGCDHVEFIFAPNPGEAARPLRAIASSGEMARVMLAVKTTLAEVDEIPVLIFDEVDANVGGETAGQVGKKLRGLGGSHQVLCITHLPQVAAQGQSHFAVEKKVKQNRTLTELTRLEGAARERELARMLGGQTEAALALAKSLLKAAQN